MPDDELLGLAEAGKLDAPEVLVAQVARMLKDSKSNALTENFTDSWLRLNDLGSMPPDTVKFPNYYKRRLEPLMKKETQHFFAHVLEENLGIEHFIDSDFTFLNRYVADHYGIAGNRRRRFPKGCTTRRLTTWWHPRTRQHSDDDVERRGNVACQTRHLGAGEHPRNATGTSAAGR